MTKLFSILLVIICLGCGQNQKNENKNDSYIKFEKLIFHTSGAGVFGSASNYHLEIDSNKQIKLFAEAVYVKDTSLYNIEDTYKMGYFVGVIEDSTLLKLINELTNIGMDTIEFNGGFCCDATMITIIVYYDGKRKYLSSMFPPEEANKLIRLLYNICETNNFKRVEKEFNIEGLQTRTKRRKDI